MRIGHPLIIIARPEDASTHMIYRAGQKDLRFVPWTPAMKRDISFFLALYMHTLLVFTHSLIRTYVRTNERTYSRS